MTLTRTTTVFAIIVLIWSSSLLGQTQSAEEIMQKSHLAMYYSADDGLADVKMTIVNSKGKERVREFTMLLWTRKMAESRCTTHISGSRAMFPG